MRPRIRFLMTVASCLLLMIQAVSAQELPTSLTPLPPPQPQIHGPSVMGVRPGSPFLYTIPATGERPIEFAVEGLPPGLALDPATGRITGKVAGDGKEAIANLPGNLVSNVVLRARNARGTATKTLRIQIGEKIALTPPMGWNSWNCWANAVDQEKVLRSARAMVSSGLINHGWTYVNIDDTWQGQRGGPYNGLQANEKFPDMKKLCDDIHGMGLKAGIYSTPWITSYAKFAGGSSDDPQGTWTKNLADQKQWRLGKYSLAANDVKQWADWGFDYLKYDWNPNDVPHTEEMSKALAVVRPGHRLQPVQLRPVRARGRLGAACQLLADHWRHLGPLGRESGSRAGVAVWRIGDWLQPGSLGTVRRPGPLERPRYAGRGPRWLGSGIAPDEAFAR